MVYEKLSFSKSMIFDLTDFAIGEILYLSFICLILIFFLRNTITFTYIISSILIIVYFFYLSWGFNYFRLPLERFISTEVVISEKKIENLTKLFSVQCNKLKQEINYKQKNKTDYLNSYKSLIKSTGQNFKYSNFSLILSYMGIKGYYNPFTNEANINSRIPEILIPVTIFHELAHKNGFASESDANFIGFLNAYNNYNIEIQYSANFFAFRYLYNDLYKMNPNLAKDIYESLSNDVRNDFLIVANFWMYYANRFQKIQKVIFDLFLKTQGQKKGIKSYNEVVNLLLFTFDGKNKFILDENT
ncbi:MAG: DUF3810 domain-containing protein [Flavobacteriaceae bacterium]